ncbi:arsenate-mycothiol transferase ArsC [Mangrovimonas aestuarii]|uniref:arsenate-mycothiol transferase ArsC n=1 Tax=Mangrovimonas aestuarii TaxID=3018443 RepID=UPI003873260E
MLPRVIEAIEGIELENISEDRKAILQPLMDYIQQKKDNNKAIRLNFICTHNSRRSHLSQIWAQAMAHYYNMNNVSSYSGGTEATALYPMVAQTLAKQGFLIETLSEGNNPVYSIKYSVNELPVIGFSKTYDDGFNPQSGFAAIMTCSQADGGCPFIAGAEKRVPITFEDPKAFDNTPQQEEKYLERSVQIASEMKYIFSNIK